MPHTPEAAPDITRLLHAAGQGDERAREQVMTLLYADLRRLAVRPARDAAPITQIDPTALVHESFLRLHRAGQLHFEDRRHFLAYAARVMRHIVVDLVRARRADKRGGGLALLTLSTDVGERAVHPDEEVLRVHEALDALAQAEPRLAQVVEMRYFCGLEVQEIAEALDLTPRTVQRDWAKARLWLSTALRD
jgi:RNA polymerase sigma factor (TIGR02999 family)